MEIVGLVMLAVLVWFGLDSSRARDAAVAAVRRACEGEGLQFLDDSVSLAGLGLYRRDDGRLALRRSYGFEYSDTGDNRRRGGVVLLGHEVQVLSIGLRLMPEERTLH